MTRRAAQDDGALPLRLDLCEEGLCARQGLPDGLSIVNESGEARLDVAVGHCFALCPVFLDARENALKTLHIVLGESARLTVISRAATSRALRIDLAAQAKLVHGRVETDVQASSIQSIETHVGAGAFYDSFVFRKTETEAACETDVFLEGAFAETRLSGVQLLRGAAQARTTWNVFHRAQESTSRQTIRTVLEDAAQGRFEGKIVIEKGARKASGAQISRALLLSERAQMRTKPELEIYEDDVTCSHGATSGDLDESALFYLRARGIPECEARNMLVHAFVEELVREIQNEDLRLMIFQEMESFDEARKA